jgi:peptidoglycan/xylan/chitin deacetylase (PgdA/CDA1 family)
MINLTASIDDGCHYDVEIVKMLIAHKVPVTLYLTVNHKKLAVDKGYPPLNDVQVTWLAKKCEIASHTVTHPLLTRIPEEEAYNEIVDSKAMLEAEFNTKVTKFAYPRGYSNPAIQQMVIEAGYDSARSTLVGFLDEPENPYFEQTTLHAGCNRKEYGDKNWFDYGMDMLEKAKEQRKANYHIWLHGHEIIKYPNGVELLEKLVRKISE